MGFLSHDFYCAYRNEQEVEPISTYSITNPLLPDLDVAV